MAATVPLEDAIKEVSFQLELGGVSPSNIELIQGHLNDHGADSHPIFQEADQQIRDLIRDGIVAEPDIIPVQSN